MTLYVIIGARYYRAMIVSYADKRTEQLACGIRVPEFAPFERIALRKLRQLQIAASLDDLRIPPGNRLERLKGKRDGQYSIRINDRYRVCFRWGPSGAERVQIVDYH